MRVSIRARTTAAFAAVMLTLLAGVTALVYTQMSAALLDEIDTGLRFRAVAAVHQLPAARQLRPDRRLQEPTEAFEQVLAADGRVLSATTGFDTPVLTRAEITALARPTFRQRKVRGVTGPARLLAVPTLRAGRTVVLVVGATMTDRADALHDLRIALLVGGSIAVALACLASWLVAGWVLRPMERLRGQADAITASGLDRRLDVPRTRDEIQRLALTLNRMLARLAAAMDTERAFLARAGHELRTPLAALRAEVDVSLRRPRSAVELAAALRSVSEETDRLGRLADDLLVLARAADGRLPMRREPVPLADLLATGAARFAAQARERGITVSVDGDGVAFVDPMRLRQVLTNLLANALRHSPAGGTVSVRGVVSDGAARIVVADSGPGFGPGETNGDGLGLRIVDAIIAGHGGTVTIGRSFAGGAAVTVTVPTGGILGS